jgi:hypothetical protein
MVEGKSLGGRSCRVGESPCAQGIDSQRIGLLAEGTSRKLIVMLDEGGERRVPVAVAQRHARAPQDRGLALERIVDGRARIGRGSVPRGRR